MVVSGGPRLVRGNGVAAGRRAAVLVALLGVLVLTLLSPSPASAGPKVQKLGILHPLHVRLSRHSLHAPGTLLRLAREAGGVPSKVHPAIVGGSEVPISIEEAPWQAEVLSFIINGGKIVGALECGGSIVDETHVVTAGHCVYNPETSARVPAEDIVVVAGSSDFEIEEPGEQAGLARGLRVDPKFAYNPEATHPIPDDVAVVELKTPITYGKRTQPIALGTPGSVLAEGTSLGLTGAGRETATGQPSGKLYSLTTTLGFSGVCGGLADAVFLCTSSPSGSLCFGDSGSGLTLPGTTVTLVGIADTVEVIDGEACLHGAENGFVNATAPEIQDFIRGVEEPEAPRGDPTITIGGTSTVGDMLTCEPGGWTGNPTYSYSFIDSLGGQVLQAGPSATYLLTGADLGRAILCEIFVTNSGGTAVGRSAPSNKVVAPPAVTSLTPAEGPLLGGNEVTIRGSGFAPTSTVSFGTTAAAGVIYDSETEISATVPFSPGSGRVDVRVTSPAGTSPKVAADEYDYVTTPTVTGLSPAEGHEAGATVVTIEGSGFADVVAVSFGATPATSFKASSSTSITAISPAGTGTVAVTVKAASGLSAETPADLYTYDPVPTVTALSTKTGPTAGGTATTITGTGFTKTSKVRFGPNAANVVSYVSTTGLDVESPAGVGAVAVTVETAGGKSNEASPDLFTYEAAPNTKLGPGGGHQEEGMGQQNSQGAVARSSVRTVAAKLSMSGGNAVVMLRCTGTATCNGKLTLTAKRTTKVNGKSRVSTVDVGTADFSIAGGGQAKVKIKLSRVWAGLRSGQPTASSKPCSRSLVTTPNRPTNVIRT